MTTRFLLIAAVMIAALNLTARADVGDQAFEYYAKYKECIAKGDVASAAANLGKRAELDTTNAKWQIEAAKFFNEVMCDYNRALKFYNRAVQSYLDDEEVENLHYCYSNMAAVYDRQGKGEEAINYYKKALETIKYDKNAEPFQTANIYNNIGTIYQEQNNLEEALDAFKKSLEISKDAKTNNVDAQVDLGMSYYNIGAIHYSLKQYNEALENMEKAYDIFFKSLGQDDETTQMAQKNIALFKKLLGK